jgi:methionyl-tRNA synthetase
VHFLIGMDEHGQKVVQAAAERGIPPQMLVDELAEVFLSLWKRLDISNDQFIRTSDPAHKEGVRALIERIFEHNPDDFYERSYTGQYCIGCEAFKPASEIVDGKCALHPTRTLESVEEHNWFFRLGKYEDAIRRHIHENPAFVQPESRRNEILSLLNQGLEDISASRARLTWAVPFPAPLSSGESQGTYVWFDALPNYLTATGFPAPSHTDRWPAQLHIVGKDITRFHCVIWPAMLMAAGLPLPERVWAHGFVLLGGDRFSKSSGVRLDLEEAIGRYGSDAFRYFLLREVPFDADGSFSWERFAERYNSELANSFGNLASRTIAMIGRYRGGVVPAGAPNEVDTADAEDLAAYHAAMDGSRGYLLHEALRALWRTVSRANEYVERQAPWKLAKDPALASELDHTLASLVRQLARQAIHVAPFMPRQSEELWDRLGAPGSPLEHGFAVLEGLDPTGWKVSQRDPLFPREAAPTE